MTREEAIRHGKEQLEIFGGEHREFIDMAIKALSQEPCEDAVSRQAVLDIIDAEAWAFCDYLIREGRNDEQMPVSHVTSNIRERIGDKDELPSVQPKAIEPEAMPEEMVEHYRKLAEHYDKRNV